MNVGDYVRTKDGKLFKWSKLCTTDIEDWEEHTRKILFIEDEIKSSPNIIDLIEVGDYVNGHKVFKKEKYELRVEDRENTWGIAILDETDIKSIVTHEQMEAMQYRVEE